MNSHPPNLIFEEEQKHPVNRKMKLRYGRLIFLLLLVAAAVFFSNGYTGASVFGSLFTGDVAAVVDDHKILISDVEARFAQLPEYYQAVFTKTDLLDKMIEEYLFHQDLDAKGYTVSDEELKTAFADFKVQAAMSDDEFLQYLETEGVQLDQFLIALKSKLLSDRFLDSELFGDISASESEMLAKYNENLKLFTEPEKVKARHILLKTDNRKEDEALAKINDLFDEYKAGAKFEDLAKTYSECPSAVNGGDLGYFTRDQMVKEFADAAFVTAVGQVSQPIKTSFGYHLIFVEENVPSQVIAFKDVSSQVEELVISEKQQKIFDTYMAQLKSKAKIDIYYTE
ncbi:MAG: peptidylprolyl isomerase [Candidatus Woesearchaeota archaeon]|jgi:parvulin-like peptidyl-prolyl isomerase